MSTTTQKWLANAVQSYPHNQRVYADLDAALRSLPTLRPKSDVYTFDDGRTQLLLCVHGLLPISYRNVSYNIPIALWVTREYPRQPPISYVVPTSDMLVKPGKYIDASGRCEIEYIQNWSRKSESCNLSALLESMQDHFSKEPPLYAKPPDKRSAPPHRPALPPKPSLPTTLPTSAVEPVIGSPPLGSALAIRPPADSLQHPTTTLQPEPPLPLRPLYKTTHPHSHLPPNHVAPTPQRSPSSSPRRFSLASVAPFAPISSHITPPPPPPPPPFQNITLSHHPHSPTPPGHSIVQPPSFLPAVNLLDEDSPNPVAPSSFVAPPPRPPNPELLHLQQQVYQKLTSELSSLSQALALDSERLRVHQSDLLAGEPAIRDEMARLEAVRDVCRTVSSRLDSSIRQAEANVAELRRKGDPEIDELVCSTTIVYNQLISLVAEDNAIEDTIYHLHRALNAGRIDLERFLRSTRLLAEEQFMKRALIDKINAGIPLDTWRASPGSRYS